MDASTNEPTLRSDLERVDDIELKNSVLKYLRGGSVVLRSPGLKADYLEPGRTHRVSIAFYTDGEWIWSADEAFYLQAHNVLPDQAFIDHMRASGFVAAVPSPEVIREAKQILGWNDARIHATKDAS